VFVVETYLYVSVRLIAVIFFDTKVYQKLQPSNKNQVNGSYSMMKRQACRVKQISSPEMMF